MLGLLQKAIHLLNWQVVNRNYPAGGKFRLTSTYWLTGLAIAR